MAINKYSLGNLHNFYYGATTATDNSVTITDTDFGITHEFLCVNAEPMNISVLPSATLNGLAGGSVTLNAGEYIKILSVAPNTWIYVNKSIQATRSSYGVMKQAESLSASTATVSDIINVLKTAGIMAS